MVTYGVSETFREQMNNESVRKVENSQRLSILYKFVEWNYSSLTTAIGMFSDIRNFLLIHNNQKKYLVFHLRERITLELFNYLAVVKTLADQTRDLFTECYDSTLMPEYEQNTAALANDPIVRFIHKLRDYFIHYEPVALNINQIMSKEGISIELHLMKNKLLEWHGWNKEASDFLAAQEDTFDLSVVLKEYQQKITDFHVWFQGDQKRVLAKDWEVADSFEKKLQEETAQKSLEVIEELAGIPEAFELGHFHAHLSSVTPVAFWARVDSRSDSFDNHMTAITNELIELGCDEERTRNALGRINEKIQYAENAKQTTKETSANT